MAIRITCIKKAGGYHEDPHEAISTLGWIEDGSGKSGRTGREEMYEWTKNKGGEAYVQVGSARAPLIAAVSRFGTRYVKTRPDQTTADNLLRLPECP